MKKGGGGLGGITQPAAGQYVVFTSSSLGDAAMSDFNWSAIDWVSLGALSLYVLIVARIGERLSFGNRGVGALLSALLFALGFAAWSYSLHDTVTHGIAMLRPGTQG
jgi:hypothetical protein